MTLWTIICAFGIPSVCLGAIITISRQTIKEITAVKLGLQAVLRDRLIQSYNHYSEKGFAPIYARDNFENMYQQYHTLGANGVMDDMHKAFLDLPIR